MKLSDLNIYDIGNEIQLVGAVYGSRDKNYICIFPGEENKDAQVEFLDMDYDDWVKFIRQTDLLEVEITEHNPASKEMVKAILRKSQRQIDASVSWKVFRRDEYKCRYCGASDKPLTVDHVVLYEDGGPSTEENLVSACKKCNRTRGNMKYQDWLASDYYFKVAVNIDSYTQHLNGKLIKEMDSIPRVVHKRSR